MGTSEAVPFHGLNRQIQNLAYGFADDLPETPDVLDRFCESGGRWNPDIYIPDEIFAEGRSLVRTLIDSGEVSGFKDPRTVLTWPFWERVFADFPDVRIVPQGLIRSPHEIAMSLVTRRSGWRGYWSSLDVIAVHFQKQKQILESRDQAVPSLCFGSPSYLKTLELAVREAGLSWNASEVLTLFDSSAVHQRPAGVAHPAQQLFESMCGDQGFVCSAVDSGIRQEKDARYLENLRLDQWKLTQATLLESREEARLSSRRASDLERALDQARARVTQAEDVLIRIQSELNDCQRQLIQAEAREAQLLDRTELLQTRLARFESHPLLGPALRGRRRQRRLIQSVGDGLAAESNGTNSHE